MTEKKEKTTLMKLFAPEHLNNNDNNSKRKYKKIMIRTKNELFAFNKEIISSVLSLFSRLEKTTYGIFHPTHGK